MVINYSRLDSTLDIIEELDEIDLKYGLPEAFWLTYEWRRIVRLKKMAYKEIQVTEEELGIKYDIMEE